MGNEADTCRALVTPRLQAAGWENDPQSIAEQHGGTDCQRVSRSLRIVAEVERRLSVVEELESVVSANLQRAVRLRQSIVQNAFTGKLLTVDDTDDADRNWNKRAHP